MKVIVTYSGGKDSQASLLWTLEHLTRTPPCHVLRHRVGTPFDL